MSQRLFIRALSAPTPIARGISTTRCAYSAFDAALASSSSSSSSSSSMLRPSPSSPSSSSSSSSSSTTRRTANPSAPPSTFPSLTRTSSPPPPPSAKPSVETELLGYLARLIMQSGKLERAHSHIALMLSQIQIATHSPPLPVLQKALQIVEPSIRIVGRKKGTKSLPTPQPLTEKQRTRQAWKWIVESSDKRQGIEKQFGKRLALEVLAVLGGQSEAIKKKEAKLVLLFPYSPSQVVICSRCVLETFSPRHQQGVVGRANVGR
ncbi:BQ2448_1807 [Microbotryum intermedium]|uniref:BQ2448_1807 protein n=1 Tax=Microbotryum intermedium TaxID=269621 RepID=A0A238FEI2_9BASI|nr:BQ2448_1807 [Microbotryum intermedium]